MCDNTENFGAAPGVIQRQQELQKHIIEDQLEQKLAHRPGKDALVQRHILPGACVCVFASEYALVVRYRAGLRLLSCGTYSNLMCLCSENPDVAPHQQRQQELQKAIIEDQLEQKLAHRPAVDDLFSVTSCPTVRATEHRLRCAALCYLRFLCCGLFIVCCAVRLTGPVCVRVRRC